MPVVGARLQVRTTIPSALDRPTAEHTAITDDNGAFAVDLFEESCEVIVERVGVLIGNDSDHQVDSTRNRILVTDRGARVNLGTSTVRDHAIVIVASEAPEWLLFAAISGAEIGGRSVAPLPFGPPVNEDVERLRREGHGKTVAVGVEHAGRSGFVSVNYLGDVERVPVRFVSAVEYSEQDIAWFDPTPTKTQEVQFELPASCRNRTVQVVIQKRGDRSMSINTTAAATGIISARLAPGQYVLHGGMTHVAASRSELQIPAFEFSVAAPVHQGVEVVQIPRAATLRPVNISLHDRWGRAIDANWMIYSRSGAMILSSTPTYLKSGRYLLLVPGYERSHLAVPGASPGDSGEAEEISVQLFAE